MKKAVSGLRGTERDVRPDRQLASLFQLQPTPDDICENKTRYGYARRMHLYLILQEDEEREEDRRRRYFRFSLTKSFTGGIYPLEFSHRFLNRWCFSGTRQFANF